MSPDTLCRGCRTRPAHNPGETVKKTISIINADWTRTRVEVEEPTNDGFLCRPCQGETPTSLPDFTKAVR